MHQANIHADTNRQTTTDYTVNPLPWSAVVLSLIVIVAAVTAAVATLVWRGSFPDPTPATVGNRVLAEARGWSIATLVVATPLAIISLGAARGASLRGRLVWLGTLAYFVYTYLEFAVSPPFTALYLLYILAFACAVPALIIGVASIDIALLVVVFGSRVPRRIIAIFSLCVASLLATAWLRGIVSLTLAGAFGWPSGEAAVGHVVHSLDLGLQVPLGIAAGVLLLRRRAAGLLVGAIMLVNVVCMGAALTAMVYCSTAEAGTSVWVTLPFVVVWGIGVILAAVFFRSGTRVELKKITAAADMIPTRPRTEGSFKGAKGKQQR